jgi:hypothetical protein
MKLNKKDQSRLHGYQNMARSVNRYSDMDMETALKQAARTTDNSQWLTRTQYQTYYEAHKGDVPHPFTIIKRYGRWNAGLEAAGLPTTRRSDHQRSFQDENCLNAIRLCRKYLGHLPSVLEYNRVWKEGHGKNPPLRDEGYPAEATIRSRFGKWRTALTQAVGEENGSA